MGCYIFEPLNPVCEGHLLVVNKHHTTDFTDNTSLFGHTAQVAATVAILDGKDYNLITSKGKAATQSVFHCYIHLVPRTEGDGLALPWTENQLNWINAETKLPEQDVMVLIRTRDQPISQYVIASWDEDHDCFVDNDDYAYTASHWCYLNDPAR